MFLRALGKSGEIPTPKPTDLDTAQATRRRFLRNLSYICDFDKGGDTCTAFGLEDLETCYGFWVALNEGNEKSYVLGNRPYIPAGYRRFSRRVSAQSSRILKTLRWFFHQPRQKGKEVLIRGCGWLPSAAFPSEYRRRHLSSCTVFLT